MASGTVAIPLDERRIRDGEWRAVALSFLYFFCVLAAYYVVRPVRDQLSAAVGSTQLPWFYAALFVVMLALTPVFSGLVARFPRRVVVPVVYGFFIACLLGFVPLFTHPVLSPKALGTVFFVWISVFNLFVVSVFWSFMTDIWDQAQARRLFPIIALGGTAGAVAGPTLTRSLVEVIGVAPLLMVSATLLLVSLACVAWLGRWARVYGSRRHEAGQETALGGGTWDGIRQVFSDPFMRLMAAMMLLGDCIGGINYALIIDYSGSTFPDAISRTRFAADLDLATNLLQVAVQLTLTRWLLVRHGAGWVIVTWAAVSAAMLLIVATVDDPHAPLIGAMPSVAIALIVSRGLAYGMQGPARESLYTAVPRSLRYKGKNAVDTAVWRFGDLATAVSMNALRAVGVGVAGLAALSALAAVFSGTAGWRLWRQVSPKPSADAAPVTEK
ncbi:NTP/NDP exchange transporter [Montanilutibacter psychrotolerans]|uniref:NTP/NDP exchange transporter n=1 Tax=Montanilutibacter psychrotolerans TaxID=1327343 RepID=UPI001CC1C425|nr:MFS transporter [Lysobacter psychrotolerans]